MLLATSNTNSNPNINPIEKFFSPILNLNDNSYLPAVFFLILTISGNFLAETFSCSVRKILTKNFLAKHILLFCVIYFTNSINTDSKDKTSPLEKLQKSFIIYLFFIMFSKIQLNLISSNKESLLLYKEALIKIFKRLNLKYTYFTTKKG